MNQVDISYSVLHHFPLQGMAETEVSVEILFVFQFDVAKLTLSKCSLARCWDSRRGERNLSSHTEHRWAQSEGLRDLKSSL